MSKLLQTLGGFVALAALLFGVTALTPAELPRVTTVEAPRSSKIACIPTAESTTVYVDQATTIWPIGGEVTQQPRAMMQQSTAVLAEGNGPLGVTVSGTDAVKTVAPCVRPVSQGVISLPATAHTELRIVNPDSSGAAVDLTLYGPEGEIQALGARGIELAANSEKAIALSQLTSEATPVGVSFKTSRGRVAIVAVTQSPSSGTAAAPATAASNHWLPGIPAGAGEAVVVLANPTQNRVTANLTAYGASTPAFTPGGGDSISLAPYSTSMVPLKEALAGEAAGLKVTADADVLAGLSVVQGDAAQIAPASAGTSLRTFVPAGGTLQVTNPGLEKITAQVTATAEDGTDQTNSLEIEAGKTATVQLASGAAEGQAVAVTTPTEVFGAVVSTGDAGTWSIPLQPAVDGAATAVEAELDPNLQ